MKLFPSSRDDPLPHNVTAYTKMAAPNAVNSKTLAHIQAHIPIPKDLESYRDVLAFYDNRYRNLIASGDAHPFLYPWATVGALLVLLS